MHDSAVKKQDFFIETKTLPPLPCDPAGTQTQDLQNRNLTLYSTKLRSLVGVRFAAEMGYAPFMLRDSSSQIGKTGFANLVLFNGATNAAPLSNWQNRFCQFGFV